MRPPEVEFAGLTASLRAPRLAVVIPRSEWQFFAMRTLEFFSRTWGGAADVLVAASDDGTLHPAVERLLRRYDPDYVSNLHVSLEDFETLHPGVAPLASDGGQPVPPHDRMQAIRDLERNGPHIVEPGIDHAAVDAVSARMRSFRDVGGSARVLGVHPDLSAPRPLSSVEVDSQYQTKMETGESLIDLALGMQRGVPSLSSQVRDLKQGTLTHREVASVLVKDLPSPVLAEHLGPPTPAPLDATAVGLTRVSFGYTRNETPLVVMGQEADDLSLAMIWDRLSGSAAWIPISLQQKDWHGPIGSSLDAVRRADRDNLIITSVSLSEKECVALMREIWKSRWLHDPSDVAEPWEYISPLDLEVNGRVDLRLKDRWDERFAAPMIMSGDGSEMATTFPLIAPEQLSESVSGWVVEANWPEQPIVSHVALTGDALIAKDQSVYETFVRPSATGIAFESGRFDFVPAGASRFGQLAQPKLRWPSLISMLRIAAAVSQYEVRASQAGKVGRVAADLWQGRQLLAEDLMGRHRRLLDAFVSRQKNNGPIDGADFDEDERRLKVQGRCLVPFQALVRESTLAEPEVRAWLDSRIETGAVRMGLVLECKSCPWHDFYTADEFGSRFRCKRCGTDNEVTSPRWRMPVAAPRWYYDLHPTVTELLVSYGDIPLMAVRRFSDHRRVATAEFELELIQAGASKPAVEVDFAVMTRDGLVLGEAKRSGNLDGNNEPERVHDVKKLIMAARILDAREICFATAATWSQASFTAMERAIAETGSQVTVSVMEHLGAAASPRAVKHNPAGP